MTISAYSHLTLAEFAKRLEPDQKSLSTIIEVLSQDNEILLDAVWQEANAKTFNKVTRRGSLPTGTARRFNQYVADEHSQVIEVTEGNMMLESFSQCDKKLCDLMPNPVQYRMGNAMGFIEGMSQTMAYNLIYANAETTDPEKITGLAPRLGTIDADGLCIDQGGSGGDTTSIFIVQWGPNKVYLHYPLGMAATRGVKHEDLGEQVDVNSAGAKMRVYRDHFSMDMGLSVADARCIARIANIEIGGTTNTFDEDNLIRILNRMPQRGRGAIIYVCPEMFSEMEIRLKDKTNVLYSPGGGEGLAGEPMMRFRGCSIRTVEQISTSETQVTT